MRLLLSMLVLLSTLQAINLSKSQIEVLQHAYDFGKQFNLQNSLRAIVMVESSGGVHLRNPNVMACGVGQILVKSWKARYADDILGLDVTDEDICNLLIRDTDLNLLAMVEELKFWQQVHGNDWRKIYASYNAGYSYNSQEGITYANKVIRYIKLFK